MTWRRHTGDSKFHDGEERGSSFRTFCNGAWSLNDELRGEVERALNPPAAERCGACVDITDRKRCEKADSDSRASIADFDLTDDDRLAQIADEIASEP